MNDREFRKFLDESVAFLRARVDACERRFGVGRYARYNYDMDRGLIWWSEAGAARVKARITVVGSVSTVSNTWLWSWANPHFSGALLGDISCVREFGQREGIAKLVEERWSAEEVDGWEMTAIAARLLESEGAYRPPSSNGFLFLALDSICEVPPSEVAEFRDLPDEEEA